MLVFIRQVICLKRLGLHNSCYPIQLSEDEKRKTFARCRVFGGLLEGDVKALSALSSVFFVKKGAFVFEEGDEARFFYVVHEGLVRVFKSSPHGKYIVFTIATSGDTLNASALSLRRYFVSAQVMIDSIVLRIEREEFLQFVRDHPVVAMNIMAIMAERLNWEYERMMNIVGSHVELRIVHSLCMLAKKFGPTLFITRHDLADFSGTTTETTIRVLSRLKKKGIISCSSGKGEIVISDLERLYNYWD